MLVDLGDTVHIGGTCRDAAGAPVSASTVALTVKLPNGTDSTVTVANPPTLTGQYGVGYVPTVEGPHQWWLRTTGPATALTGGFDVRGAFPRFVLPLADAKAHLNKTAPDDDEELRPYILTAGEVIEKHLGEKVIPQSVTDPWKRLERATDRVALTWAPVVSLTSAATIDGLRTWDVADLRADPVTGILHVIRGSWLCGTLEITYVAGRTVIPERYKMAARMIIGSLWASQRPDTSGRRPAMGGGGQVVKADGTAYRGADFPEAMRLLGAGLMGLA